MNTKLRTLFSRLRYPIMTLGFLALFMALLGGIRRIGFSSPWIPGRMAFSHGGLMVSGFLGIVIGMERAVAIDLPGSLTVPLFTAVGTTFLLVDYYISFGVLLIVLSSFGLLGFFFYIFSIQPSLHNFLLITGGSCWTTGNILWWFQVPVYSLVGWWLSFLVFVVSAERLELNRLVKFSPFQKSIFVSGIVISFIGMLSQSFQMPGKSLFGIGFCVLATWLINNDMIRKTLNESGERGYTSWCLFTGYIWLGFGGAIQIFVPNAQAGFYYDAYIHSIFVGFVFTMIFGHAFIIMPGVLNIDLSYHYGFFIPLILLETTLFVRILGDLSFDQSIRSLGGLGNALSIVLFLMMVAETQFRNFFLK